MFYTEYSVTVNKSEQNLNDELKTRLLKQSYILVHCLLKVYNLPPHVDTYSYKHLHMLIILTAFSIFHYYGSNCIMRYSYTPFIVPETNMAIENT